MAVLWSHRHRGQYRVPTNHPTEAVSPFGSALTVVRSPFVAACGAVLWAMTFYGRSHLSQMCCAWMLRVLAAIVHTCRREEAINITFYWLFFSYSLCHRYPYYFVLYGKNGCSRARVSFGVSFGTRCALFIHRQSFTVILVTLLFIVF